VFTTTHTMRAKKSLGQNFLNSKTIAHEIVRSAELSGSDTVLEIGPGKGFLTAELLKTGAHIFAIEKDDRLIPFLQEKFAEEMTKGVFTLIHDDVTNFDPHAYGLNDGAYKLIANIPYYLTGYIIRTFLETPHKPERMILMIQKEVADRIVARDKKESILSIAVKAYGTPRIVKKVPARYFTPAPNVDSAVLAIEHISNTHFTDRKLEKLFFDIVKTGFAHKRKQLAGNLKELFGNTTSTLLAQTGISPHARAEDITLEEWLVCTKKASALLNM